MPLPFSRLINYLAESLNLQWLDFVLAQKDLPQTISTSYGDDEQTGTRTPVQLLLGLADTTLQVPKSFAERVCNGFAQLGLCVSIRRLAAFTDEKLGARGVSLTFSSGDNGVGDGNENPATTTCISNDGKNRTMFLPAFPASCPL